MINLTDEKLEGQLKSFAVMHNLTLDLSYLLIDGVVIYRAMDCTDRFKLAHNLNTGRFSIWIDPVDQSLDITEVEMESEEEALRAFGLLKTYYKQIIELSKHF